MNLLEKKFENFPSIKNILLKMGKPIETIIDNFFSYFIPMNTIIEDLPYLSNSVTIDKKNKLPIINYNLFDYEKKNY